MLSPLTHRHRATRMSIPERMPIPMRARRDGHDHQMRTVALASAGAGMVVGTAAGALLFGGRHAPTEEPPSAQAPAAQEPAAPAPAAQAPFGQGERE
jgi:hypothetical protein